MSTSEQQGDDRTVLGQGHPLPLSGNIERLSGLHPFCRVAGGAKHRHRPPLEICWPLRISTLCWQDWSSTVIPTDAAAFHTTPPLRNKKTRLRPRSEFFWRASRARQTLPVWVDRYRKLTIILDNLGTSLKGKRGYVKWRKVWNLAVSRALFQDDSDNDVSPSRHPPFLPEIPRVHGGTEGGFCGLSERRLRAEKKGPSSPEKLSFAFWR